MAMLDEGSAFLSSATYVSRRFVLIMGKNYFKSNNTVNLNYVQW